MDEMVNDAQILCRSYKQDWLWALFFPGMFVNESAGFNLKIPFRLPVIPYSEPILYTVAGSLTDLGNESAINYKGVAIKEIIRHNVNGRFITTNTSTETAGSMDMTYLLYPENYRVQLIKGSVTYEENKTISVTITHLPEKDELLKNVVAMEE